MSLVYAKNSGILQAMGGSVNLNSIIETVASGSVAGVATVQGVDGAVILSSDDGSVSINVGGNTIDLSAQLNSTSIANGAGAVSINDDTTITIQTDQAYINIYSTTAVNPNGIELSCGSMLPTITMAGDSTILLDNPGATNASSILLDGAGGANIIGEAIDIHGESMTTTAITTIISDPDGIGFFIEPDPIGASIVGLKSVNGEAWPIVNVLSIAGQQGTVLLASSDGSITFDVNTTPGTIDIVSPTATDALALASSVSGIVTTLTTADGVGAVGTSADTASTTTSLWAYSKYALVNSSADACIAYSLTGTTMGGVITGWPTGSGNALPQNTWSVISTIIFNIPPAFIAGDSVYYDGWFLADFDANFNSYGGITYSTDTYLTEIDIIGSSTATANALNFSNIQQIYFPVNIIIPATHLTVGGTITLKTYSNPTSSNHYLTQSTVVASRIGLVKD